MCPIIIIQTLHFCFFLVPLRAFYAPAGIFGFFYSILYNQWIPNKILLCIIINLINLWPITNYYLIASLRPSLVIGDCYSLQHLSDLDSHQSPSSLPSAIEHLNLFYSSPTLYCILEWTSPTPYDTLLVNNLGSLADFNSIQVWLLTMSNAVFLSVIFQRSMK